MRLAMLLPVLLAALLEGAPRRPVPALARLKVSENRRFLVREDGTPFFYLADTAWELFHRLDRKQAIEYLDKRASQKYTAVQAVALAELDGISDPNPYGKLPLTSRDPARPAVTPGANPAKADEYDYWDHVDFIVDEANRRGIYVGLLPTWGRWMPHPNARSSEVIFTGDNARKYGEFLGKRYANKGIIWILGGDRLATGYENVWRALAAGIATGVSGREDYSAVLMSYHPNGGGASSAWFHDDEWLDFNMHQTGHGRPRRFARGSGSRAITNARR